MTTLVDAPAAPRTTSPAARVKRVPRTHRLRRSGPVPKTTATRSYISYVLAVISLLALWVLLYAFVLSAIQEHRSQGALYDVFRSNLAQDLAPLGGPIGVGEPVAMISVPSVGLDRAVVVEGTDTAELKRGPGHRRDTVLPGMAGSSVIYGRSATFGRPFAKIVDLRPGALVKVTTQEGIFNYRVIDVRRAGDTLPVPVKAGGSRLVLETSGANSTLSGLAPSQAVYADANLVGQAMPTDVVAAISPREVAMASDTSQLPTLLIWLEGLFLATAGVAFMATRWGRWQTWVVGTPIILALLWGATSSAALLLPNLV